MWRLASSLVFVCLGSGLATATVYDVGPGQTLTEIGQVPWHQLAAGDEVRIHWRSTPYRTKWVINRRGTPWAPIVVRGIGGPAGERPVVTGDGATTPAPLNFWNEQRGVIKIGGSNVPPDGLPAWVVIEGLEIRSGHPSYTFTADDGSVMAYSPNAAAIYVEKAEHLVIRNCDLHDSGNGLFVGVFDGATQDVRVERNFIHGNGNVGSIYEHNSYTAALGIVFEGNRFGPLRSGAGGNNLKDRSAGLVVRYNWIEAGNRQLDLVDGEDSAVVVNDPRYRQTFVYGNVLIEPDGAGNSQIAHYGGDSGDETIYRKGMLYFYNNTVVSTRAGNTTLLRLSTNDEQADVRNNVLYVSAAGAALAMLDETGVLFLSHNWLKPGWVASHGGLAGTIHDDGTSVLGGSPGFVDLAGQDFHLVAGAQPIDAATDLPAASFPSNLLERQYVPHQATEYRVSQGVADIGAYERCTGPACGVIIGAEPAGLVEDAHASGGTSSNVNSVLEPGETVLVNPSWKNIGAGPLALTGTASAFLGPAGATYSLLDSTAGYGTIAPGATADSYSAGGPSYRLFVSNPATRPAAHWDATFLETLSSGQSKTWTLHVGKSFADVPASNGGYSFVENIFHNGITAGCGGGNYCPGSNTTRWQAAVLLSLAMVGPSGVVPAAGSVPSVGSYNCTPGGTSLFSDVPPTDGGCRFIHYIYAQGLTAGCGNGHYCPSGNVTRWQMAVFLASAMAGSSAAVPSSGTVPSVGPYDCTSGGISLFGDVPPDDGGCRFIHYIYANGATAGCGGGNYCPASNVTRWQMAVFLVTGFHIPFLH